VAARLLSVSRLSLSLSLSLMYYASVSLVRAACAIDLTLLTYARYFTRDYASRYISAPVELSSSLR